MVDVNFFAGSDRARVIQARWRQGSEAFGETSDENNR
jgi:hypothetical protein